MPDPIDPTLNTWPVTICTQIIQCLSIVCACCLYLKPFLDSLESGLYRSNDRRRCGSNSRASGNSTRRNVISPDNISRSEIHGTKMQVLSSPQYATDIEGGYAANADDSGSQHSRTHIIKETRTFAVETFPNFENSSRSHSCEANLTTATNP